MEGAELGRRPPFKTKVMKKGTKGLIGSVIIMMIFWSVVILISYFMMGCQGEEFCSCDIETDGNPEHITFVVKGCDFCCYGATMPACDTRVIDSIGESFLSQTLETETVCGYEDAHWYYLTGKML